MDGSSSFSQITYISHPINLTKEYENVIITLDNKALNRLTGIQYNIAVIYGDQMTYASEQRSYSIVLDIYRIIYVIIIQTDEKSTESKKER